MSRNTIKPASNHLIAWAGRMTAAELEAYLDEPGGRFDGPHSAFMADLGRFCDHDYIWAQAADDVTSLRDLANANGLRDEVLVAAMERRCEGVGPISAFIVLWNYRLEGDLDRQFAGGKLHCLGSWPHPSPISDD